ncbi:hypothetical protein EJB05_08443, partial [Eragrostis curvula]
MEQSRAHFLSSLAVIYLVLAVSPAASDMADSFDKMWGDIQVFYDSTGHQIMSMTLDRWTTSAFRSKSLYLFGRFDIEIKLVPKDSAGTVTTLYMVTEGPWQYHDEIDLEFLGNTTGEPYTLHTNIYAKGKGGREKQHRLWFDPTQDFNTYSIIWNSPHEVVCQHLNADDWATQGGRIKTDWSQAPFTAFFRNYSATACVPYKTAWICGQGSSDSSWFSQELDEDGQQKMQDVDNQYKIYDYCTDSRRFPNGYPQQCGSE